MTPFRSEKNSNLGGRYGRLLPPAGQAADRVYADRRHQESADEFRLLPDIGDRREAAGRYAAAIQLQGHPRGHKDMNAYFAGEAGDSRRDRFFYVNDDTRASSSPCGSAT